MNGYWGGNRSLRRIGAKALAAIIFLGAGMIAPAGAGDNPNAPMSSDNATIAPPTQEQQGVSGVIVTRAGQPVGNALVTASPIGRRSGPIPDIAIFSDAEGHFFWPLRPGSYRLQVSVDGHTLATTRVSVGASEQATELRIITRR